MTTLHAVSSLARGPAHERLEAFIGRWINRGTRVSPDGRDIPILSSDVYEWAPGGHFVVHSVHGLIGSVPVGGIEIIGVDDRTGDYRATFYDSEGNTSHHKLVERDGDWIWSGGGARCTLRFSHDGGMMVAHHERELTGGGWEPWMDVTLTRTS